MEDKIKLAIINKNKLINDIKKISNSNISDDEKINKIIPLENNLEIINYQITELNNLHNKTIILNNVQSDIKNIMNIRIENNKKANILELKYPYNKRDEIKKLYDTNISLDIQLKKLFNKKLELESDLINTKQILQDIQKNLSYPKQLEPQLESQLKPKSKRSRKTTALIFFGIISFILVVIIAIAILFTTIVLWFLVPVIGAAIWINSGEIWIGFEDILTPSEFEKFIKIHKHALIMPPTIVKNGKRIKMKQCDIWGVNRNRIIEKGLYVYNITNKSDLLKLSPQFRNIEYKCKKYEYGWNVSLAERIKLAEVKDKKQSRLKVYIKKKYNKKD